MERFDLVRFRYDGRAHAGYIDEDADKLLKIYDLAQERVRGFEKTKISELVIVDVPAEQKGVE